MPALTMPRLTRPTIPLGRSRGRLPDDWQRWFRRVTPQLEDFAPHHKDAGAWLESIEPDVRPRPFIAIWPRGHGKSTFAEHGVAYLAERRRRQFALYVCATQDAAEVHVSNIQSLLEKVGGDVGRRLENQYGHSKGWKKSMLRTASGFNCVAFGLDQALRGIKLEDYRPDLIIFDDIDGRHDSPALTKKKIEILTESLLPTGSDDAAVWGVQNLIIPNGIFSRMADNRADYLGSRIVSGPIKAVQGLVTEEVYGYEWQGETLERNIHVIRSGTPTWSAFDLETCQQEIVDLGWKAFDREKQNNVKDVEGALWSTDLINATRVSSVPDDITRTVVAVDPASTSKNSSDETGIIGAARDSRQHGYVLADESGTYKPAQWGRKVVLLHDRLGAACVIAEKNNGGEMVEHVVVTAAKELHQEGLRDTADIVVTLVHASKGKRARAEPVSQKYDEHTVHHVGDIPGLEEQMTTWDASDGSESPDRVDALVWGMTDLLPLTGTWLFA